VGGVFTSSLLLVYLAIGVAALAGLMLIVGVLVWRAEIFGPTAARRAAEAPAGLAEAWPELDRPVPTDLERAWPEPERMTPAGSERAWPEPERTALSGVGSDSPEVAPEYVRPGLAAEADGREAEIEPVPVAADDPGRDRDAAIDRDPGRDPDRDAARQRPDRPPAGLPGTPAEHPRPVPAARAAEKPLQRDEREMPAARVAAAGAVVGYGDRRSGGPETDRPAAESAGRPAAGTGFADRRSGGPETDRPAAESAGRPAAEGGYGRTRAPGDHDVWRRAERDRATERRGTTQPADPGWFTRPAAPAAPSTPGPDTPHAGEPPAAAAASAASVPATEERPAAAAPAPPPPAPTVPAAAPETSAAPGSVAGTQPVAPAQPAPGAQPEPIKEAEPEPARGAQPDSAQGVQPAGPEPAVTEEAEPGADSALGPDQRVQVVPGITRYHRDGCILIRFLGPDDLETMTRERAEAAGCVPCKACKPDRAVSEFAAT
jgi:hypothetical protein